MITNRMSLIKKHIFRNLFFVFGGLAIIIASGISIWIATLSIPDFASFESRRISMSTKIYDRTSETVLYDLSQDYKRTVITLEEMGAFSKNATIAIEDPEFYKHQGIKIRSLVRATLVNLTTGGFTQGGSTITQQIIKNTLLTQEKTISRKIKELVLALKVEKIMSKEEILSIYLNDAPYGGNIYGIAEASRAYFNKKPVDLSLAESAYLASIPKAPTYYSPFGKHKDELDSRKDLVLLKMYENNFTTKEEYDDALKEEVVFLKDGERGIRAPHFVFYVKDYLVEKYGEESILAGGLKVITTLDYEMQNTAEEILKRKAIENSEKYNASNAGLVAIDPKTGQILSMVGSRDYFDIEIDGAYNIATAKRQPGSSFKPFVYARALVEGYTPNTILIDAPTEFNSSCNPYGDPKVSGANCYMPRNFTGKSYGPLSIRQSLARSINITAVKMLYLVGIRDATKLAEDLGIRTLVNPDRYGLTLVLGGGEVRLVDMTGAYGVFANNGVRNEPTAILKITNNKGDIVEEYTEKPEQVLDKNIALQMNDILSDNNSRIPIFPANSPMYFSDRKVAAKTGTSNDFKDGWILGYTPDISVGVWVGNNDNIPMKNVSSISTAAPIWREFMNKVLPRYPNNGFEDPVIENEGLKPVLNGEWRGGITYTIDTVSGKLATEHTPKETRKEIISPEVHDILYWVDKQNPRGPKPENPGSDPQFVNWETAVQNWFTNHPGFLSGLVPSTPPQEYDDIHIPENFPEVTIKNPNKNIIHNKNNIITIDIQVEGAYLYQKADFFLNDAYIGGVNNGIKSFSFNPNNIENVETQNELKVIVYDVVFNIAQTTQQIIFSD